jgi:hypothetical protein
VSVRGVSSVRGGGGGRAGWHRNWRRTGSRVARHCPRRSSGSTSAAAARPPSMPAARRPLASTRERLAGAGQRRRRSVAGSQYGTACLVPLESRPGQPAPSPRAEHSVTRGSELRARALAAAERAASSPAPTASPPRCRWRREHFLRSLPLAFRKRGMHQRPGACAIQSSDRAFARLRRSICERLARRVATLPSTPAAFRETAAAGAAARHTMLPPLPLRRLLHPPACCGAHGCTAHTRSVSLPRSLPRLRSPAPPHGMWYQRAPGPRCRLVLLDPCQSSNGEPF